MVKNNAEWIEENDEEITDDDLLLMLGISREELEEEREMWQIIKTGNPEELNAWLKKYNCEDRVELE